MLKFNTFIVLLVIFGCSTTAKAWTTGACMREVEKRCGVDPNKIASIEVTEADYGAYIVCKHSDNDPDKAMEYLKEINS